MSFPDFVRACAAFGLALVLTACGGGGGGGGGGTGLPPVTGSTITGNNVLAVHVDAGDSQIVNRLYASVTVCQPGTGQCRTVDNVLVDTGSTGLRLLSSALAGLALPGTGTGTASSLLACQQFLDGSYVWGPVVSADVVLGNKTAAGIPVQVIADPTFASPPAQCSSNLGPPVTSAADLGANGILGIGMKKQDCGPACTTNAANRYYFSCASGNCAATLAGTTVALDRQIQNPIPHFSADNNGLAVILPAVTAAGAPSMTGSIVFGVASQGNNQPTGATLLQTADGYGYINTRVSRASPAYSSGNMPLSFLDTGSNGLYFGTTASVPLPSCYLGDYFCPTQATAFSATLTGSNNASRSVTFAVDNAQTLYGSGNYVLPGLAGPSGSTQQFDWGLPFFYGRTVFIGIEGMPAGSFGTGPFYAF